MSECDKCGLKDPECHCYLYELEERISFLEENMDQLTDIVNSMNDYIREKDVR